MKMKLIDVRLHSPIQKLFQHELEVLDYVVLRVCPLKKRTNPLQRVLSPIHYLNLIKAIKNILVNLSHSFLIKPNSQQIRKTQN
jgi:hypothetical protein